MSEKVLISNRKAYHDYHIGDKIEAGIALVGTEVKSLRASKANLTDGWVEIGDHGIFLCDIFINHYSHGNIQNHEETRKRPLLLNKREIVKLQRAIEEKGMTIVPTKIYLKGRHIKVEIAPAKGKKNYDKRESQKKKDADRDIQRVMKNQ